MRGITPIWETAKPFIAPLLIFFGVIERLVSLISGAFFSDTQNAFSNLANWYSSISVLGSGIFQALAFLAGSVLIATNYGSLLREWLKSSSDFIVLKVLGESKTNAVRYGLSSFAFGLLAIFCGAMAMNARTSISPLGWAIFAGLACTIGVFVVAKLFDSKSEGGLLTNSVPTESKPISIGERNKILSDLVKEGAKVKDAPEMHLWIPRANEVVNNLFGKGEADNLFKALPKSEKEAMDEFHSNPLDLGNSEKPTLAQATVQAAMLFLEKKIALEESEPKLKLVIKAEGYGLRLSEITFESVTLTNKSDDSMLLSFRLLVKSKRDPPLRAPQSIYGKWQDWNGNDYYSPGKDVVSVGPKDILGKGRLVFSIGPSQLKFLNVEKNEDFEIVGFEIYERLSEIRDNAHPMLVHYPPAFKRNYVSIDTMDWISPASKQSAPATTP